jgi:sterol desaturase/sphingolipid hydroxylase (fatty acid hydroxylase superfamily)
MRGKSGFFEALGRDLEAPLEARRFGSGWFAGFFALVLAIAALGMVIALRWPGWLSMPELVLLRDHPSFRVALHVILLASYGLALLSLLLRRAKVIGFTALACGILAALLGGANVQPEETRSWGIFFGLDFFVVNMLATGLMFAPIERLWPHRREQRLFRPEWGQDLFYYLVSSMMVQVVTYLSFAPSNALLAHTTAWGGFRAAVGAQPWLLQLFEIMVLTDLAQYWFHRAFHGVPFLWGFHAVHHSAKSMDWLASARMHFIEMALLRGVTAIPMLTFGFVPSAMQAYVGIVYIYSALLHANLGGDFLWLGKWVATPRFHHWHHALDQEGTDVNFAIHFPWLDRIFGTYHMPERRWPKAYGVPEQVPSGYRAQMAYPFRRKI